MSSPAIQSSDSFHTVQLYVFIRDFIHARSSIIYLYEWNSHSDLITAGIAYLEEIVIVQVSVNGRVPHTRVISASWDKFKVKEVLGKVIAGSTAELDINTGYHPSHWWQRWD